MKLVDFQFIVIIELIFKIYLNICTQEQWFCEGQNGCASSGLIEARIRNWRKCLSPGDKAAFRIRKKKVNDSNEETTRKDISQEALQMQQWLKENSTPKSIVIKRMHDTATVRDVFIFHDKHILTEILDAWPRLLDAEIVSIHIICIVLNITYLNKERKRKREIKKY